MRLSLLFGSALVVFMMLGSVSVASGQTTPLSADLRDKIDKEAGIALARTGAPSASVTVVKDSRIAYSKAYGSARIEPRMPATPEMQYSIGSISKQFTAAAILFLQEEGRLSLDDKVAKFLPNLTRSNEVTIRQLLSHTSGYQDYWPQDYLFPMMRQPIAPQKILDLWASKPLDFDPGTKWQYSNTNYVIAGIIVEKVSGKPLFEFLRERIFVPLKMKSVTNVDQETLGETNPTGYTRYALGPLHVAPNEGNGWLFSAGGLAMPAEDLAKWDISIIDQKLMKPPSYHELGTEVLLKNGLGCRYGLGINVGRESGRRSWSHAGEVSGFAASNLIFPDERVAVVVLTNQDGTGTAGQIAGGIAHLLLGTEDAATPQKLHQALEIFAALQRGAINRSLFTDNANSYFSEEALKDFALGLGPLGTPQEFNQTYQARRGGMISRGYRIQFAQKTLNVSTYEMPDGKLEQYQITAQD